MASPALTLGRDVVGAQGLDPQSPTFNQDVVDALARIQAAFEARGWDGPAQAASDVVYQAVYTKQVGGDDKFYGGTPNDPLNPTLLDLSAAGTSDIVVQWEGVEIGTEPIINFTGDAVTSVTDDAGNTRIIIDIDSGGGGGSQDVWTTIAVDGQLDLEPDSTTDTLTLEGTTPVVIETNASDDKLIFSLGPDAWSFKTIHVTDGLGIPQTNIVADAFADTLNVVGGVGMQLSTSSGSDTLQIDIDPATFLTLFIPGAGIIFSGSTINVEIEAGKGLEFDVAGDAGKLRVKEGTLIDVDSNGVSVDLTEATDYDGTSGYRQSVSHESGGIRWFAAASIMLGKAQGAVSSASATFTADNLIILAGKTSSAPSSVTVQNHFAWEIDDNGNVLLIRDWDSDTWYCVQAQCPA